MLLSREQRFFCEVQPLSLPLECQMIIKKAQMTCLVHEPMKFHLRGCGLLGCGLPFSQNWCGGRWAQEEDVVSYSQAFWSSLSIRNKRSAIFFTQEHAP